MKYQLSEKQKKGETKEQYIEYEHQKWLTGIGGIPDILLEYSSEYQKRESERKQKN